MGETNGLSRWYRSRVRKQKGCQGSIDLWEKQKSYQDGIDLLQENKKGYQSSIDLMGEA